MDLRDVVTGSTLGDPKVGGDLAVGKAPGHYDGHFLLAGVGLAKCRARLVPRAIVGRLAADQGSACVPPSRLFKMKSNSINLSLGLCRMFLVMAD